MTERTMFDADGAPTQYPGHGTTVAAGYLAGGRNNGWTAAEWDRVRAFPEVDELLPIYVASPAEAPANATRGALDELHGLGVPAGSTVLLDLEHDDFGACIAAGYPRGFDPAGYLVCVYCSESNLAQLRAAGWTGPVIAAEWTGAPHEVAGAIGVQWAAEVVTPGGHVDLSTIYGNLALWPNREDEKMTKAVAIAVTPSGNGYWCFDDDGGVFCFGDATFHGSMGGHHLNAPVIAAAAAPKGDGYVMYAADKGVFPFGSVKYHGNPNDPHQPAHAGPHHDPQAVARAQADARAGLVAAPLPSGPPPDDAIPAARTGPPVPTVNLPPEQLAAMSEPAAQTGTLDGTEPAPNDPTAGLSVPHVVDPEPQPGPVEPAPEPEPAPPGPAE